ncbi:hemin import ATP-binding protein HmuV [bacterium BMS3Bbin11]|nr:hemin import ATP-binding protein HmuV [bacterium BMS3Abin11]GBE46500.1 hemin import ATP-binding protein HmuV [bacterium BMS3Bbin11]
MSDLPSSQLLKISDLIVAIEDRILCRSLSVYMSAGETWSILGPNGSGKTTLLLTLAGLQAARSGEVLLDGEVISSYSSRQLAVLRSMLFQKTDDAFPATVMETVLSGRHPHIPYWQTETNADFKIAQQVLDKVDMAGLEDRDVNNLSGGERQRVSIAACLAQNSPIRMFDEPVNHLDMKHQNSILRLISENYQRLNLVVLQDINQAWRYCSHALLLYLDGSVETGSIEDMLTIERLEALYDCRLKILQDGADRFYVHS